MTHSNGAHPNQHGSPAQAGGRSRTQTGTPINVQDVIGRNTRDEFNNGQNHAPASANVRHGSTPRSDFAGEPGVLLDGPNVSTLNVLLVGSDAFCTRLTRRFTQAQLVVKTSCTRDYLMALGQASHIKPDIVIGQIDGLDAQRHAIIVGLRRLAPGVKLIVIAEPEKESFAIKAVESGFDEYLLEPVESAALASLLLQETDLNQVTQQVERDRAVSPSRNALAHDSAAVANVSHQTQAGLSNDDTARDAGRSDVFESVWLPESIDMTPASAALVASASDDQKTAKKQGNPTHEPAAAGSASMPAQPAQSKKSTQTNPASGNAGVSGSGALNQPPGMYGDDPYDTADAELGDIDLVDCLLSEPARFEALVLKLVAGRSGVADVGFTAKASDVPAEHSGAWVTYRGKRLGVLHAPPPAAKTQLAPWASWIAHWLAMKQQMTSLWNMANKDELTGAWNRRFFDRHLARVIAQATQKRFPVTVLVFDIDNFKTYNDRYGHPAGDEILRETVRLMNSVVREHDIVARVGGDEFAVIFWDPHGPRKPNSSHPDDVRDAARRFQQAICSHHFPKLLEEAPGTLTISGGLASYPWDGVTAQSLVERADTMLLHSKTQGKNAITFGAGAARGGDPFEHDA